MNTAPRSHPFWKLWSNPIFRRYCRSRLRPRGLGVSLLIVVLLFGFIVGMANALATRNSEDAEAIMRVALMISMVFQAFLLFVVGTAQVAGGMTAERDEGVIDYQRLIPMSPLAKVAGYLFGLPIREYVLFLATLPFAAWLIGKGNVEPSAWLSIYTAAFTSTLLYHFTGLVTGTVARNRRWAFLLSIGLVFALYTVIPQLAKFGLVFFKYLTVGPVVEESLPKLLPRTAGAAVETLQNLAPTVKFFGLDFSELVFSAFSQLGLILTFLVILCRKWRRFESHLLGKLWATGFFIWIQVLFLGNALPLIEPGNLFLSRGFARMFRIRPGWTPAPSEAVGMCAIYGVVTLVLIFVLASIVTPTPDSQLRGWRRARKQGRSALPFLSDAATGFWAVVVMAIAGAAGWFLFTRGLVESHWFPGHVVPTKLFGYFAAVMLAAGVGFQVLLEARGGRVVFLTTIFAGVVPVMVGSVIAGIDNRLAPIASWLIGVSPLSWPVYASASLLSLAELPENLARAVPRAFQFWLFVSSIASVWLVVKLKATRKAMAKSVLAEPVVRPEPVEP